MELSNDSNDLLDYLQSDMQDWLKEMLHQDIEFAKLFVEEKQPDNGKQEGETVILLSNIAQKSFGKYFDKDKVSGFFTHCLNILQEKTIASVLKYYIPQLLMKLTIQNNTKSDTHTKRLTTLMHHPLLKYMEEIALCTDPLLPLQQKGKTIFAQEIKGNHFINIILQILVYWGTKFPYNHQNQPSKLKGVLDNLNQQKVVLPDYPDQLININKYKNTQKKIYHKRKWHKQLSSQQSERSISLKQLIAQNLEDIQQLLGILEDNDRFQDIQSDIIQYHKRLTDNCAKVQHSRHLFNQSLFSPHQHTVQCYFSFYQFFREQKTKYQNLIKKSQGAYAEYKEQLIYIFNSSFTKFKKLLDIQPNLPIDKQQTDIYNKFRTNILLNLKQYNHPQLFQDTVYPWEALPRLPAYIQKYISSVPIQMRNKATVIGSAHIDPNVIIGQGTIIEHGAMIKGPAIIGSNCQLRKGSYVRDNVIVGDNCIIGNSCELKGSIIFQKSQISHFNYVGDSILAQGSHLSAGAITSNFKFDGQPVKITFKRLNKTKVIETQLTKFGAFIGQHAQVGCNAVLNPGSIIGRKSIIYPCVNFRGYLPPGHIVKLEQNQKIVVIRK